MENFFRIFVDPVKIISRTRLRNHIYVNSSNNYLGITQVKKRTLLLRLSVHNSKAFLHLEPSRPVRNGKLLFNILDSKIGNMISHD